jgi:hypothetical protein
MVFRPVTVDRGEGAAEIEAVLGGLDVDDVLAAAPGPIVLPLPCVLAQSRWPAAGDAAHQLFTSALLPPSEKVTFATADHISRAVLKVAFSASLKAEAASNV